MSDLEARIKILEDREEIRRLKHYYYCTCVDRGVGLGDQDALAELVSRLSDDVVCDFTEFPLAVGKKAATEFFAVGVPAFVSWCQHRVMNEVISINGDTATGEWYVDCNAVLRTGHPLGKSAGSTLIVGRYEEQYAREGGVWRWKRITAFLDVHNSFGDNWSKARFVDVNR